LFTAKATKMIQNLGRTVDKPTSIIIEECFENNVNNWEEIDTDKEFAKIQGGRYVMENRDDWSWKYYDINVSINKHQNFIIEAKIKIENIREIGQFGIIWGFDKKHAILNRFTIAADLKRFSIIQFEKDHLRIYHRFTEKLDHSVQKIKNELTIVKNKKYLFFKINKQIVYICHEAHFHEGGPRIGFYVEPGVKISSSFLTVQSYKN